MVRSSSTMWCELHRRNRVEVVAVRRVLAGLLDPRPERGSGYAFVSSKSPHEYAAPAKSSGRASGTNRPSSSTAAKLTRRSGDNIWRTVDGAKTRWALNITRSLPTGRPT